MTDDQLDHKHVYSRFMAWWASYLVSPRASVPVFSVALLIIVASVYYGKDAQVGENQPGSPILFQDSQYNVAAARIAHKFAGANQLSIYFEADEAHKMKDPEIVDIMQQFGRTWRRSWATVVPVTFPISCAPSTGYTIMTTRAGP